MVFPRGFSRPTGDSRYGDSVGGPALGLSASPVLNLNIFFAPGLHSSTARLDRCCFQPILIIHFFCGVCTLDGIQRVQVGRCYTIDSHYTTWLISSFQISSQANQCRMLSLSTALSALRVNA